MTEWVEGVGAVTRAPLTKIGKITRTAVLAKIKICHYPGGNVIGFFIATK